MAAHYVPRLIDDPREKLRWNEDALRFADAVADDRVASFYASLYAMVGQCRLAVGDALGASIALEAAGKHLSDVPPGPYRDGLKAMIEALARPRHGQSH